MRLFNSCLSHILQATLLPAQPASACHACDHRPVLSCNVSSTWSSATSTWGVCKAVVCYAEANYVNCLLIHAGWQLHQEDMALPAAVLNARADLHRHLSILLCRKPDLASTSDVVLTGLGNARVLQRFKLNTRVALVTGSALTITSFFAAALLPYLSCRCLMQAAHQQ